MGSLQSRNFREKVQQIGDGEAESDHGTGITTVNELVKMFVLVEKLHLHRVPNGLVQVFFFAQMLLHFFVQELDILLYVFLWIFIDHLSQFLPGREKGWRETKLLGIYERGVMI